MSSSISSFFSSIFPVVHADSEEKPADGTEAKQEESEEPESEAPAAEEDEEPEDAHPILREECKESAKCATLTKHFEHCQEKVHAGQGFKGEDCVEELCACLTASNFLAYLSYFCIRTLVHMMHCVDECAAPKLFAKLR